MHQAEIIVLLLTAVGVLAVLAHKITLPYPIVLVLGGLALSFVARFPAKSAADSPARHRAGVGDNVRSCLDRAFHCAGASMGGCFCPRRNCLPTRCGCGDGDHSPARRSSSHTSDTRG